MDRARSTERILLSLHVLIAINAIGGALYGLAGAEAIPREWLAGTPFRSYAIPSVVLLLGIGGSQLLAAHHLRRRTRYARGLAQLAGILLMGWIVAQVAPIGFVSWLQPTMFMCGLLEVLLARQNTRST